MRFRCRVIFALLLSAAVLLISASPAGASTLYGSAYSGSDGLADLYTLDPATGAATLVGSIGFQRVSSLDFGPEGRLYGVGERDDGTDTVVLIVIDTATGAGAEIAPLGFVGADRPVPDISIRPSDHAVYAYLDMPDEVARFDLADASGGIFGPSGTVGGGNGIAFSKNLTLYHWDSASTALYTVNQLTGAQTFVGNTTFVGFPPLISAKVNGMDTDPSTGVLYASINDGGLGGPAYLAKVNPATLEIGYVTDSVRGLDAIAFEPDRCPVVLYGADGGGHKPSRLLRIDPISGAAVPIGPINFDSVGGLEVDPLTGKIFGIGVRPADGTHVLISIDPTIGAGAEIGPLVNAGDPGAGGSFDISFRSNGALRLTARPTGGGTVSLFRLDTLTGMASLIGVTGTNSPGNGLAFSRQDALYLADTGAGGTMYTLDDFTGAATPISAQSFLGFPPLTSPRINAMDTDPGTGIVWASVNDGTGGAGPDYLAWIDPWTGIVRNIRLTATGLDGIAFAPVCDDNDPCTIDRCVHCEDGELLGARFSGQNGLATLIRINPNSGASAPIGSIGFERVSGMDYDPETGILYATGERADGSNTNVLIAIDPTTGAGNEIGPTNIAAFGDVVEPDLSIRPSDGKIYAYLEIDDELGTIDRLNGSAAFVGATGVGGFGNGIAFDPTFTLYHADGTNVNTLDQSAGTAAMVAALSFVGFPAPAIGYRVSALDTNCDGRVFASVKDGLGGGPAYLGTLEPASGVVTNIGLTDNNLDAIAWITRGGFCRYTFVDTDNDSVCDGLDCAPGDPAAWSVPPEITDDTLPNELVYTFGSLAAVSGPGTLYDVAADLITALPVGPVDALGACSIGYPAAGVGGIPIPPLGNAYWLIARGRNICGFGPWGDMVTGGVATPRMTATCP